jgi:hypothetical protein
VDVTDEAAMRELALYIDMKCPPKGSVLKTQSPMQQCSEVQLWGGDWLIRALTSSMC